MRISRLVITAVLYLAAIGTITACGGAVSVSTTVPTNINELQSQEPGKSLKAYGYEPVANLYDRGDIMGELYMDCGETTDPNELEKCSQDVHNRGTNERPNVYVVGGMVVALEGSGPGDDRRYYAAIPDGYQDFSELDAQQKDMLLLRVMPEVAKTLGNPDPYLHGDAVQAVVEVKSAEGNWSVLVDAEVRRGDPHLVP